MRWAFACNVKFNKDLVQRIKEGGFESCQATMAGWVEAVWTSMTD